MVRRSTPDRIRLHNPNNFVATHLGNWLETRPFAEFTLNDAISAIGYDPEDRRHRTKVYNVINYWRKKAKEVWDFNIYYGIMKQGHFAENWGNFLQNYNSNYRAFYLLFDSKEGVYYQPDFTAKERLDQKRAERKVKALRYVLSEMAGFDESLIVTGRPIREALEEADKFTRKYITDHTYELEQI